MNTLNRYFRGLIFDRVSEKKGYAIYAAAIHSFIGGDKQRYILAFVPSHLAIKSSAKLRELPWKNLQMRLCPKHTYNTKQQEWVLNHKLENLTLTVKDRNKHHTTYIVDTGEFEALLLHNPKNKSMYQYPQHINIHWAIDQFNTSFTYTGITDPLEYTSIPVDTIPLPRNLSSELNYELV